MLNETKLAGLIEASLNKTSREGNKRWNNAIAKAEVELEEGFWSYNYKTGILEVRSKTDGVTYHKANGYACSCPCKWQHCYHNAMARLLSKTTR